MARKKVNLQWISNDSTRRATLKKRKASLMKKTSDLAKLCGIKACVVVYGEGESQPEVWPSVPKVRQLLSRFKAIPDYLENCKKKLNQEEFLRTRISHIQAKLSKCDHEIHEHETLLLLHETMVGHHPGLTGLTYEELSSLAWMIERKVGNAKEHFDGVLGL